MQDFRSYLESRVLAHVSGASGSGKSTLGEKLSKVRPDLTFKDLDDFDEDAVAQLGWNDIKKNDYTDEMLSKLAKLRQRLTDSFIHKNKKPIVFVGLHTEGDYVLHIPTRNRFLLDVDAKTSAWRAYKRSRKGAPKYRRTLKELPGDECEAQSTIDWLKKHGYKPLPGNEIEKWIANHQ